MLRTAGSGKASGAPCAEIRAPNLGRVDVEAPAAISSHAHGGTSHGFVEAAGREARRAADEDISASIIERSIAIIKICQGRIPPMLDALAAKP